MDDFNNIPTGSWIDLLGNGHRYKFLRKERV